MQGWVSSEFEQLLVRVDTRAQVFSCMREKSKGEDRRTRPSEGRREANAGNIPVWTKTLHCLLASPPHSLHLDVQCQVHLDLCASPCCCSPQGLYAQLFLLPLLQRAHLVSSALPCSGQIRVTSPSLTFCPCFSLSHRCLCSAAARLVILWPCL